MFYLESEPLMNEIIVLCTTGTLENGRSIASALVEAGEAACVNIIPGIQSIYRWEGKVCEEGEFLLIIKSVEKKFEAIKSRIRQIHSYQVPEIIAVPIRAGDEDYLKWLHDSVQ